MPRLTDEQRAARRDFIGASDIGAIAGFNPYRDAVDVLNEKMGFVEESPEGEIDARELGHRLEPFVRGLYVEDQGVTITPAGTLRHPSEPWAGATLDSKINGTRRGLEIKVVGFRTRLEWDPREDDGIPHYVRCQAAWQMWCVDLDEIDVAALLCSTEFRIWRIPRDRELEAHLTGLGRAFWLEHVKSGKAPPIGGSESVRNYLDHKYPPAPKPVIVPADEDVTAMVLARKALGDTRDEADKKHREITHTIIAWLGERNATACENDRIDFRYNVNKNGERRPWAKVKQP